MILPAPIFPPFPYTTLLRSVRAHAVPPVTSLPTWFTVAPLHASVAVGGVNEGGHVHRINATAWAFPIVGACVSTTVIVSLLVTDVLLHASTAFHVLVTVRAHAVPPVTSIGRSSSRERL